MEQDAPQHLHQLTQASLQAKDLPWEPQHAHQRPDAGRKHQGTTTAQQPTPTHPRYPSPLPQHANEHRNDKAVASTSQSQHHWSSDPAWQSAWQSCTAKRLRRRREEPATTRGAGGGGPASCRGLAPPQTFLGFLSGFLAFRNALCFNTIIPLYQKYLLVLFPEEITPTYQYVARTDGC